MTIEVLIVDDSQLIRNSLRAMLTTVARTTNIREATTLDQALDSVRRHPPTLVILDMSLPDGMGMDIIEPLRLLAPTVVIAMLTVYAHHAYRKRCLELGANWFFDKFTETEALMEVVLQHAALNPIVNGKQGAYLA